ncbi:RNA-binding KH domain-containing protein PEPPER isoform X1 [Hevea brasiliensis]|uniref:RNA-binding KH domain-containing protein PEPPER isoform X1 n=1 Tax=Hevea brasiliensis TaxID=3981 RepID=UPI0025F266FD|nr:RNA-binding KH domain-containing protein PEPPER isoform X1 [Hevea brasiliensis]
MSSPPTDTINSVPPELNAEEPPQSEGAQHQQLQPQTQPKWPGWPGDNVFRLIVPVVKVGSIIGRKGKLVKKMCDETRARIRILEGPLGIPDRVVLISGKEEPEAALSPAMDAVLRVYKRVSGLSAGEADGMDSAVAGAAFCFIRLLVASSQAINLIGKQGSTIKSIQENTGAVVRVLAEEEVPSYATSDERIVEIHGEAVKVLKALEAVTGHLRKFLVDHSVIPIFEKTVAEKTPPSLHSAPAHQIGIGSDYSLSLKRDPSIYDRETHLDPKISQSGLSLYGQDSALGGLRSTGLGRATAPIVTQMTQTTQVPLSYAEDIIGVGGSNIAYIRSNSGAILTIQESRGLPDEITVEIKGTTSQVQMAQLLIQEFISTRKEPTPSVCGKMDSGFSSYSQVADTSYPSSSFASHLGGYGSSSLGGYGSPSGGGYSSYRF